MTEPMDPRTAAGAPDLPPPTPTAPRAAADPTVRMPAATGGPPPPGTPPPPGDGNGPGDDGNNAKWWWIAAIAILAIAVIVLVIVLASGGDDDDTSTTTSSSSTTSTSSTTLPTTTTTTPPTTQAPTTSAAGPAPAITGFTGPPSVSCTSETTVQLAWSTSNASRTTISIDGGGVFAEYGPSATENVPFACDGDDHTYTLTAIGTENRQTTSRITVAQAASNN